MEIKKPYFTRPEFLGQAGKGLIYAAGALMFAPVLFRQAWSDDLKIWESTEVLITVFLRGACDGLNFVPPIEGEDRKFYESARPNIKIPVLGEKAALKLDERFGFHPSAKAVHELFKEKRLAIIHAAGQPSDSRSHFDAQNFMELGTPGHKSAQRGWLARHLDEELLHSPGGNEKFGRLSGTSFMTALAVGSLVPTSLYGFEKVAVINNLGGFNIAAKKKFQDAERDVLRKMYQGTSWLDHSGSEALSALEELEKKQAVGEYKPANGAEYPKADIGNRLKMLAQLIKMKMGIRAATIDMGGWDTHKYQGAADGQFANLVTQLSESMKAFDQDMKGIRFTLVVMSEFGRRVKENASRGTDHGHGSVMLVLGERIRGGKVYGAWPGLATENLYERADLAVTTDYRQVLAEVLGYKSENTKLSKLFPGYKGFKPLGLI